MGFEPFADGVDTGMLANAGEDILQLAALWQVVEHIVERDQGYLMGLSKRL